MKLDGQWKLFYYQNGEYDISSVSELVEKGVPHISATVPGNVELDLIREGLLPEDIFRGTKITEAEKYELYDWWYLTKFTPEAPAADEEIILCFEGVDCFADYFINGKKIGFSDNALIAHEFAVTDYLKYGADNILAVHIKPSTVEEAKKDTDLNTAFYDWHFRTKSVYVRKPPHAFGWDIMPRAESAGLWRSVELKYLKKTRFTQLFLAPRLFNFEKNFAVYQLCFKANLPTEYLSSHMTINIHGKCGDKEFDETRPMLFNSGSFDFKITEPELWWPRPYGEAKLYDCTVTLSFGDKVLCRDSLRFGIRKAELVRTDTTDEEKNGKFEFHINGKKILCIGTNWVPLDVYHSRDKQRYAPALELLKDVGSNMVRCWGGNVYEDHEFFDFCDENGIMVWQDFGMACHMYPQDEDFLKRMDTEVSAVIRKLRQHPSIVVWAGDNECDQIWSGNNLSADKYNKITREVIPMAVLRNDCGRPYLPSSPYVSDEAMKKGLKYLPEDHLWDPKDYYKNDHYRNSLALFISETGYHGCPAKKSLEKFIEPEYLWPCNNNPQWNFHSTDQNNSDFRTRLMPAQVKVLFGEIPDNIDEFVAASQISQAEGNKFFIERVRSDMEHMGGILWWNLLDGWPQMSDAVVDYYFEKKLSYHYIKRISKPFILLVNENGDLVSSNMTFEEKKGSCSVTDVESGKFLFEGEFSTAPNSNENICRLDFDKDTKGMVVIKWECDGKKGLNTYLYGKPAYSLSKYKEWIKKSGNI